MKTTGLPKIPSRMTKRDVRFCFRSHETANPAKHPIESGSTRYRTIDGGMNPAVENPSGRLFQSFQYPCENLEILLGPEAEHDVREACFFLRQELPD